MRIKQCYNRFHEIYNDEVRRWVATVTGGERERGLVGHLKDKIKGYTYVRRLGKV